MKYLKRFNEAIESENAPLEEGDIIINKSDDSPCEIITIKETSVEIQNVRKSKEGIDSTQWYGITGDPSDPRSDIAKFYQYFDCGGKRFVNFINKPTSNYKKIKSYFDFKDRLTNIHNKRSETSNKI